MFMNAKPWMIAAIVATSSLLAQSKNPKCAPMTPATMHSPMTSAYNAPSRINVRGAWDLSIDGSFIYWQPIQENMEIGIDTSSTSVPRNMFGISSAPVANNLINLNTSYDPGFQVGLGMNFDYDMWESYLKYTWFHTTNSTSSNGTGSSTIFPTFGNPETIDSSDAAATENTANGKWNLKMDIADWQLARCYYVGTRLTFRPFFGIRAAWIRQTYDVTYVSDGVVAAPAGTFGVTNRSVSWGVGPEVGLTTNYTFSYGLRFFGDFEADVIYTRYSTSFKSSASGVTPAEQLSVRQRGIPTVRPHTNLDLGLGWGSYFDSNNWHFDMTASYGFQVFWNQNMFRHFNDDVMVANSTLPSGNLYTHGLNLMVRFDF